MESLRSTHRPERPRAWPGAELSGALACEACGYGVARPTPPERCPMCQAEGAWVRTPRRPAGRPLAAL